MGTNYYVSDDPTCDNPEHTATLHIGKSSAGWKFGFHGIPEKGLTSWRAWQDFLEGRSILTEYGNELTLEVFRRVVEVRAVGRNLSRPICRVAPTLKEIEIGFGGRWSSGSDYHDDEGYDFYDGEFL